MTKFGQAFGKIKELQEAIKKSKELLPYVEKFGEEIKKKYFLFFFLNNFFFLNLKF